MKPETGKLQQRLQALQHQYREELAGKISQLEKNWRQFIGQKDRQALDSLLHDAHNLTGSGALYGYHQISTIARELEQLLTDIQKSRKQPGSNKRQSIERCIRTLHLTAQNPVQPATPP